MQKNYLGEFEELVLLTVAVLSGEAYGALITQDISARTRRSVQISAVHVALYRLEEKGFLNSHMGGSTQERGGRRKRFFTLTPAGAHALQEIQAIRSKLWQGIPQGVIQLFGI